MAGNILFSYFYVCFFKFLSVFVCSVRCLNVYANRVSVVNLGSLLFISGSYLWMFFVAKTTHRATETLIRHRSLSESAMAWRMSLLVATDAACWVPIIGLGLWSLAGFTVHPQVPFYNSIA